MQQDVTVFEWLRSHPREAEFVYAELFRCAYRLTQNQADAGDRVQEVLLRLGLEPYRSHFVARAKRSLLNLCRNKWKRASIRHRVRSILAAQSTHEFGEPEGTDPPALQRAVAILQDKLTPEEIETFLLRFFGFTYEEIARELKCSQAAARKRVSRVRMKIRNYLDERTANGFPM